MIGHNVIGKIYKSKEIISLTKGYRLKTKFKSNYGGIKDLELFIRVNVNGYIIINTNNDLLLNTENIDKSKVELIEDEVIINNTNYQPIDKIIKPDLYNTQKTVGADVLTKIYKDGLYIPLITETNDEYKVIDAYLIPSIYENKEYIELKIDKIEDEKIVIKKVS